MHRFPAIRTPILFAALMLLGAACGPASADDRGWQIQLTGVRSEPDVNVDVVDDDGDRVRAGVGGEIGFGLGFEYRFSRRLGLAFGAVLAEHDLDVTIDFADGSGSLALTDGFRFTPVTAGLRVHLTPDRAADVTIGLGLAYVLYGDISLQAGPDLRADFESDDDFGWGVGLGVDAPFGGGPWSFLAAVDYLDTTLQITDRSDGEVTDLDFDPFLVRLGFGYRF